MTRKIEAIIREEKLDDVKNALFNLGILGFNVAQVRGRGREFGVRLDRENGSYRVDLISRVQINIILSDHNVDATIDAIYKAAHTGEEGDGMVFVYPIEEVVRLSTGERGRAAILYEGDIDMRQNQSSQVSTGD